MRYREVKKNFLFVYLLFLKSSKCTQQNLLIEYLNFINMTSNQFHLLFLKTFYKIKVCIKINIVFCLTDPNT